MTNKTKLLIALSVFAVLNGVTMPPRDAHADKWVIDGQDEFNALLDSPDWTSSSTDDRTNLYLKDSASGNTIIFKGIKSELSLLGGHITTADNNNNTIVLIDCEVDTTDIPAGGADHVIGGFTGNEYNANNNKVIIKDSRISAHIFGGDSHLGDACNNLIVIDNSEIGHNGKNYSIYGGYAYVHERVCKAGNGCVRILRRPDY